MNKEQLIKGLAAELLITEKDSENNRFLGSTGTLLTSGAFVNYAICNKSSKGFTSGTIYECGLLESNSVKTVNDLGTTVTLNLADVDFEFILNHVGRI